MAQPEVLLAHVRNQVNQILSEVENAQAKAAALCQAWDKLNGSGLFAGYDWTGSDITAQDFLAAINTLQTAFPDLLGTHGETLYKLKW